jgi:hypothetical protein
LASFELECWPLFSHQRSTRSVSVDLGFFFRTLNESRRRSQAPLHRRFEGAFRFDRTSFGDTQQ